MPELKLNFPMEQKFLLRHKIGSYSLIQPEPAEHLVGWMEEQGYKVGYEVNDWRCKINVFGGYSLNFPNDEIMSAFLIKWM